MGTRTIVFVLVSVLVLVLVLVSVSVSVIVPVSVLVFVPVFVFVFVPISVFVSACNATRRNVRYVTLWVTICVTVVRYGGALRWCVTMVRYAVGDDVRYSANSLHRVYRQR